MTDLEVFQQLSAAGRHQDCLQACQNALQANPEEAYAYKYAGKSLLALGQFKKAQQCLLKAHQLDSNDPEIVKDIGNISLSLGNKGIALGWYERALEIDNNYAPVINNLATLKRQSGNNKEAIDLFKRAIQADPKLIQAYVGAAASFLSLSDLNQAASFANQALAINESAPGINEILGIVFQNKSNHDQAIECYQKELEVNPQASNSLLNLGLLLLQKGQIAAAIESLVKVSAVAPSEQCSLLLANAYQAFGQFKEASIEYKKLNINQSKNKMIPFNLGLCLLNTGNNIDAIDAFKIAVKLDETFIAAWGNTGSALIKEGRYKEALEATQKVLELQPDNADAHMNVGSIYKDLGKFDQALVSTLKSLELSPDNSIALMNLGGIYQDLGQLDQALASTLKSLELSPDDPIALMNLGGVYQDLGQLDQALASTLKSLELKSDNPDSYSNLGLIYRDLGQFDQALASTLKSLELKPDNANIYMSLGCIYKSLDQPELFFKAVQKFLSITYERQDFSDPIESILIDQEKLYSFFKVSTKGGSIHIQNYFLMITSMCLFESINPIDWYWIFSRASNNYQSMTPFLHLLPYTLLPDDSKKLCSLAKQACVNSCSELEPAEERVPSISPLNIKNKSASKRLSFGFLSNDVINHSCSPFLYAITSELIKQGHVVTAYTRKLINYSAEMESSQSSFFISSKGVSLHGLGLEESRNLISNEKHDVLIDAEGLTNDLYSAKLLDRHLAPCQLTWLGYPGTTGNSNIDFFLTDQYYNITDNEYFAEQALVIDGSACARYPIIGAPDPGECPFIKNGYITFGSLNNSYKITPLIIKTWSKIMLKCDLSRFVFFRKCYSAAPLQASINTEFEKNGISSSRISYIDSSKQFASHFDCYNKIDISLDTFPLTGGVTTFDSLWMGVPVITIEGGNMHQRISSSFLRHAGIPEFIGSCHEEMIEIALRMASDKSACIRWRKELRSHLLSTDLFNPSKTALSLAKEIGRIVGHKR